MRLLASLVLAAVLAAPLSAQGSAVTRRDLATAYLQVDRVAMTRGIPAERRAEWNRQFDRTTLAFFGGDFPRVLREMHDLLARMLNDAGTASPTRQLLALRLDPGQRTLVTGRDRILEVSTTVMYTDSSLALPRSLTLRLLDGRGTVYATRNVEIPATAVPGQAVTVTMDAAPIINGVGRYRLEATLAGAQLPLTSEIFVMAAPAEVVRARLERALGAVPASADPQDVAAVRARIALITDRPDPANSAQFLANPAALAAEIDGEIRALASGRKPYELRAGDYWRTITGPTGPIPARLYAPREVALGAEMPVVIALHGAGADENMFFEGYGAGRLRSLADSAGFILLSPNTTAFTRDVGALDSALAVLERLYVIDRNSVFVIGHSMGGAATVRLAAERKSMVRAAAVIAGTGAVPANGQMSPLLFVGAETDLVIPMARVRAAYSHAVAAGAVVEFQQADGWGHTLVVGARIDDVVRWVFSR